MADGPLVGEREEVIWATGLFEGEGCFSLHSKGPHSKALYPSAQVTSTDRDVIERFGKCFPFGRVRQVKRSASYKSHWKDRWIWASYTFEGTQATIAAMWAHLGERRQARAVEVLQKYAEHPNRMTRPRRVAQEVV